MISMNSKVPFTQYAEVLGVCTVCELIRVLCELGLGVVHTPSTSCSKCQKTELTSATTCARLSQVCL